MRTTATRMRRALAGCAAVALFAGTATSHAEPWLAPGDPWLRHDVQVLADAGLIRASVLAWPLAWADIAADLDAAASELTPVQQSALQRVRRRAAAEMRIGETNLAATLSAAYEPDPMRTFLDTPREEGEAALSADWLGDRFAVKAVAQVVADPDDGQSFRGDGSYLAAVAGNWMLSFGLPERWWGPGWQGSLILSSNARPVPAVAIDRIASRPFESAWLRWIGPWRFSSFMGQLEGVRDHPHALLFGMRFEMRPHPTLQVALSRTAQWCGDGRPCDLATFGDLLVGNDNDPADTDEPGNQLAGFDVRWAWPGGRVPAAIYAQAIGEDEASYLPSRYLGLFGVETWGEWDGNSWRAHAEYADTACDFLSSPPEFSCAYEHGVYTTGYRFRGRAIGHPMDGDGESIGFGLTLTRPSGVRWQFTARNAKLNRAGASLPHTLASVPATVHDLAMVREQPLSWGNIQVSLGYATVDAATGMTPYEGLRGHLTARYGVH